MTTLHTIKSIPSQSGLQNNSSRFNALAGFRVEGHGCRLVAPVYQFFSSLQRCTNSSVGLLMCKKLLQKVLYHNFSFLYRTTCRVLWTEIDFLELQKKLFEHLCTFHNSWKEQKMTILTVVKCVRARKSPFLKLENEVES